MDQQAQDQATESGSGGQPKKKAGGKLWLTVIGALVVASAGSAAGATFGPSVKQKLSGNHPAEEKEAEKEEKGGHIAPLDTLVIDVRDEGGESHHMKVGIALEIGEVVPEEEWKNEVVPRARDATIGYMRSLKYEDAANAAKFETMRTELQEHLAKALKKPKVKRVYFIDFVVQ